MDFTKLTRIQNLDKRLKELEAFKGDLPEKVKQLKTEFSDLTEKFNKKNTELEQIKKDIIINKSKIDQLNHTLKKYQEQIYSVKTNKEYDAITTEIENIEKKVDDCELTGVELLEREEQVTKEVEELNKQVTELKEKLTENETELNKKMAQTENEERELLRQRESIVKTLDRRLYSQYERIRKAKDGMAIAEVRNYTCSGCFTTIPAQTVLEIRKMDHIIVCEMCGRILITPEMQNEKTLQSH